MDIKFNEVEAELRDNGGDGGRGKREMGEMEGMEAMEIELKFK